MITATVIEAPLALEPVTPDPFIDDLIGPRMATPSAIEAPARLARGQARFRECWPVGLASGAARYRTPRACAVDMVARKPALTLRGNRPRFLPGRSLPETPIHGRRQEPPSTLPRRQRPGDLQTTGAEMSRTSRITSSPARLHAPLDAATEPAVRRAAHTGLGYEAVVEHKRNPRTSDSRLAGSVDTVAGSRVHDGTMNRAECVGFWIYVAMGVLCAAVVVAAAISAIVS